MRNRKYRKKGLGISTIALMVLCIALMVLPMNVAATGIFSSVSIDGIPVPYGTTYHNLDQYDPVNGTYTGASVTPIFEWRLDFGGWNAIIDVSNPSPGVYEFEFIMDKIPDPGGGSFWIQASEEVNVTEWHCYYD